ncbi:hypothetical protein E2C01_043660 [Portunus trituberculatus]|uniref:Uncharacterized protein n=1 Tax=Portunus trituberculatus TaxID=210409 RepID=A0A5B7FWZ1_PORTR|nr:hypothetical protein [Portunus trituberculatus]
MDQSHNTGQVGTSSMIPVKQLSNIDVPLSFIWCGMYIITNRFSSPPDTTVTIWCSFIRPHHSTPPQSQLVVTSSTQLVMVLQTTDSWCIDDSTT